MNQIEESEAAYAGVSEATYAEVGESQIAREEFDVNENECYGKLKVVPEKNTADRYSNRIGIALVVIVLSIMLLLTIVGCIVFALEISS